MSCRALVQRVDELDIAVAAEAENLRHLLLDQIVDDYLSTVEHIALSPSDRVSSVRIGVAENRVQAGAKLFLIMLYVN